MGRCGIKTGLGQVEEGEEGSEVRTTIWRVCRGGRRTMGTESWRGRKKREYENRELGG